MPDHRAALLPIRWAQGNPEVGQRAALSTRSTNSLGRNKFRLHFLINFFSFSRRACGKITINTVRVFLEIETRLAFRYDMFIKGDREVHQTIIPVSYDLI